MYNILGPQQLGRYNFTDRYVALADCAWRPVNGKPLEWRARFYESFMASEHSKDAFRLIEYQDEKHNTEEDVGMVAILPLRQAIAAAHLEGVLSQYALHGGNLSIHHSPHAQSFHYVQSVYLHHDHLKSVIALQSMRTAIYDLLKRQFCGYRDRLFFVYCEALLPPGKRLAIRQGLRDLRAKSKEGAEIFGYDSAVHHDPMVTERTRRLWVPSAPRAA